MTTFETQTISAPRRWRFLSVGQDAQVQIREYAPTFATEFAVMASQILVFKLAAHLLGKQGFSEYALARRFISSVYPLCLLGLGVALPRYVAIASKSNERGLDKRFFGATLWCLGFTILFVVGLMNLFPQEFAFLVFGDSSHSNLVRPISLIVGSLALHSAAYGYLRGHLQMARANIFQLVNLGIAPLLAFVSRPQSVDLVLLRLGFLSSVVSAIAVLSAPWRGLGYRSYAEAKTLLSYGIPRLPGDFAQMALFGLPAFLVAHRSGIKEAGYVAFGTSVLSMISAAFAPVGLILLPKASQMIASKAHSELRGHVERIIMSTCLVSIALTLLVLSCARFLIRLYLGPSFVEAAGIVQILALGALPLSLYCALRGLVDAYHKRAINTRNNVIVLSVFLAGTLLSWMFGGAVTIVITLVVSLFILGVLTMWEVRNIRAAGEPAI